MAISAFLLNKSQFIASVLESKYCTNLTEN